MIRYHVLSCKKLFRSFGATLKMNLGEYRAVILDSGMRAECGARFHSLIHNILSWSHEKWSGNKQYVNKQLASQCLSVRPRPPPNNRKLNHKLL